MIYFTYFFTLILLSVYRCKRYEKAICCFLTFLVFAITYPAGYDWIGYFRNYNCIINLKCNYHPENFEFGFNLLVYIFGGFGFIFYNFIIVIINSFCLYRFSKNFKNKTFIYLSLLSFMFWVLYLEAIRQSLAISMLLLAIPYLYNGKILKYIIFIIIASSFHVSAIICLLFLIPKISKLVAKISYLTMVLSSLIFWIIPFVFLDFIHLLLKPFDLAYRKMSFYLASDAFKPQWSAGLGSVFDVLLIFLILNAYFLLRKRKLNEDRYGLDLVLPGISIYICFAVISGKMMPVVTRIGWYGIPFLVILLNIYIADSVFFKKNADLQSFNIKKILVYLFFIAQIARPLSYGYSRYGIFHQTTIFQESAYLNDKGLLYKSKEKCKVLQEIGLSYLCPDF